MENKHKHIRIRKNAIANVSENCPQETIEALAKMVDLVNGDVIIKPLSFIVMNMKMLRKMNSMSQQDLVDRLKINRSSIGAYEENRAEPKLKTVIELCDFFGVPIDEFLKIEIINVRPKYTIM